MYNMNRGTYECDYCGTEMQFYEHDAAHGDLWGCEDCETIFCTKCFIDRHGHSVFHNMLQEGNRVYCPDYYEKHKEEYL